MVSVPAFCMLTCVAITAVAAVTDTRTGKIPNWLTLPPLVVAPLVWALHGGVSSFVHGSLLNSIFSIALCTAVPFFLWRRNGIAGGDLKLFAAIGALALWDVGVQAQFYSFCAGALVALARMAWEGQLLRTLGNTFYLALNPVLPRHRRREMSPALMTKMRFGVPIFIGTLIAILANNRTFGLL